MSSKSATRRSHSKVTRYYCKCILLVLLCLIVSVSIALFFVLVKINHNTYEHEGEIKGGVTSRFSTISSLLKKRMDALLERKIENSKKVQESKKESGKRKEKNDSEIETQSPSGGTPMQAMDEKDGWKRHVVSVRKLQHGRPMESPQQDGNVIQGTNPYLAYLLVISNEYFVDGAMVLAVSLRKHSTLLKEKKADMVLIIPKGKLSINSIHRLYTMGHFNDIIEVESLAERAPRSPWKDTFDKIYMFNITQYKKVVFMDADMVCVRSMDKLFDLKLAGDDGSHLGAIGGMRSNGDSYFQTGMMVIQPSEKHFKKLYDLFITGVPPKGHHYNTINGRDGILIRDHFRNNFHTIDKKYSRNLDPRKRIPNSVISLHLRGTVKPWYSKEEKITDPDSPFGKRDFGFPYIEWWRIYEDDIHCVSLEYAIAYYYDLVLTEQGEHDSSNNKAYTDEQRYLSPNLWKLVTKDKSINYNVTDYCKSVYFDPIEDEMNDEDDKGNKYVSFNERLKEMKSLADSIPTDDKIRLLLYYGRRRISGDLNSKNKKIHKKGNEINDDKYNNNSTYTQAPFVCSRNFLIEKCDKNEDNTQGKTKINIISPLTHVWMMRNSDRQYIRLLSSIDKIQRQESLEETMAKSNNILRKETINLALVNNNNKQKVDQNQSPSSFFNKMPLVIRTGVMGKSCDEVCGEPQDAAIKSYSVVEVPSATSFKNLFARIISKKEGNVKLLWSVNLKSVYYHNENAKDKVQRQRSVVVLGNLDTLPSNIKDKMKCIPEGFLFSPMQDCGILRNTLGCKTCDLGVYWRHHPGNDYPASVVINNKNKNAGTVCHYNFMNDLRALPTCGGYNESSSRLCPCIYN